MCCVPKVVGPKFNEVPKEIQGLLNNEIALFVRSFSTVINYKHNYKNFYHAEERNDMKYLVTCVSTLYKYTQKDLKS